MNIKDLSQPLPDGYGAVLEDLVTCASEMLVDPPGRVAPAVVCMKDGQALAIVDLAGAASDPSGAAAKIRDKFPDCIFICEAWSAYRADTSDVRGLIHEVDAAGGVSHLPDKIECVAAIMWEGRRMVSIMAPIVRETGKFPRLGEWRMTVDTAERGSMAMGRLCSREQATN